MAGLCSRPTMPSSIIWRQKMKISAISLRLSSPWSDGEWHHHFFPSARHGSQRGHGLGRWCSETKLSTSRGALQKAHTASTFVQFIGAYAVFGDFSKPDLPHRVLSADTYSARTYCQHRPRISHASEFC